MNDFVIDIGLHKEGHLITYINIQVGELRRPVKKKRKQDKTTTIPRTGMVYT